MAKRGGERTLGSDVYRQLRDDILNGRLQPGARLRPSDLRLRYQVSVSVMREALTRLAAQRLVVAEPNQGFAVARLTRANLDSLVEARCAIEGLTMRLSVGRGDLDWESRVLAVHHRLEGTAPRLEDGSTLNPDWVEVHGRFHATLLEACGNSILTETCAALYDNAELYRRWNDADATSTRDVAAEHRGIAGAALARDADRAAQLLIEHIERTRDMAIAAIPALSVDQDVLTVAAETVKVR